ncbi:hypothetical protein FOL46_006708 [Perkinsus olseni]|uniref:Uncharacterized protein n=1 Tax=Perkinsus olseni TaxID=32597 RepID=A0A7J6LIL9_PEROL|nr:hypothetical protein FOL46_006708 [Perkinsus olseni]
MRTDCLSRAHQRIFGDELKTDEFLSSYCCGQFVVSRKSIMKRSIDSYNNMNNIIRTGWNGTGCEIGNMPCYIAEFLWQKVFTGLSSLPLRASDNSLPLFLRYDHGRSTRLPSSLDFSLYHMSQSSWRGNLVGPPSPVDDGEFYAEKRPKKIGFFMSSVGTSSAAEKLSNLLEKRRLSNADERLVIIAHPDGMRSSLRNCDINLDDDDDVDAVEVWYVSREGEDSPDLLEVILSLPSRVAETPDVIWIILDEHSCGGHINITRAMKLIQGEIASHHSPDDIGVETLGDVVWSQISALSCVSSYMSSRDSI